MAILKLSIVDKVVKGSMNGLPTTDVFYKGYSVKEVPDSEAQEFVDNFVKAIISRGGDIEEVGFNQYVILNQHKQSIALLETGETQSGGFNTGMSDIFRKVMNDFF